MKNASTIGWRGHPCEGEKAALGDETKRDGKAANATRLGDALNHQNTLQLVTDTCNRGLSCAKRAVTGFEEGLKSHVRGAAAWRVVHLRCMRACDDRAVIRVESHQLFCSETKRGKMKNVSWNVYSPAT